MDLQVNSWFRQVLRPGFEREGGCNLASMMQLNVEGWQLRPIRSGVTRRQDLTLSRGWGGRRASLPCFPFVRSRFQPSTFTFQIMVTASRGRCRTGSIGAGTCRSIQRDQTPSACPARFACDPAIVAGIEACCPGSRPSGNKSRARSWARSCGRAPEFPPRPMTDERHRRAFFLRRKRGLATFPDGGAVSVLSRTYSTGWPLSTS